MKRYSDDTKCQTQHHFLAPMLKLFPQQALAGRATRPSILMFSDPPRSSAPRHSTCYRHEFAHLYIKFFAVS
ncbi:hypothetical protein Plhal304r1_c042g0121871 [Plasmopara halstedii]